MIEDRISGARRTFHAFLCIGSVILPTSPVLISRIHQSVILPKLTYGLELLDISNKSIYKLETAQKYMARRIQGLPQQTASPAVLTSVGWWSISSHLVMKRLMMLWQILILPMDSVYKQIVMEMFIGNYLRDNVCSSGPTGLMYRAAKWLGLECMVACSIQSGSYMDKSNWKATVRKRIQQKEVNKFTYMSAMYSKLALYRRIFTTVDMWPWWSYGLHHPDKMKDIRMLLRLTCGESDLNRDDVHVVLTHPLCEQCTLRMNLTPEHVLFECPSLHQYRTTAWMSLEEHMPPVLWTEINSMNFVDRTSFLLSGLRCGYVPAWDSVYTSTLLYIRDTMNTYLMNIPL